MGYMGDYVDGLEYNFLSVVVANDIMHRFLK